MQYFHIVMIDNRRSTHWIRVRFGRMCNDMIVCMQVKRIVMQKFEQLMVQVVKVLLAFFLRLGLDFNEPVPYLMRRRRRLRGLTSRRRRRRRRWCSARHSIVLVVVVIIVITVVVVEHVLLK